MKKITILFIFSLFISCNYTKTYIVKKSIVCETSKTTSESKIIAKNDRTAFILMTDSYLKLLTMSGFENCTINHELFKDNNKIEVVLSRHTIDSLIDNTEGGFNRRKIPAKIVRQLRSLHYYR